MNGAGQTHGAEGQMIERIHSGRPRHRRSFVLLLSTACALTAAPTLLHAQNTASDTAVIRIAQQHARLAAQAPQLSSVRQHLQHVLNCLEGERGADYRASAGDPCHGTGARAAFPERSGNRVRVEKAIRLLTVGVTFHDFKPAHYVAEAVQAVLEEITG